MLHYIQIILEIIAIFVGLFELYNKFILKSDYDQGNFILLALVIFYLKDSKSKIIGNLLIVIATIIIIIMFDKLIGKIKLKGKKQ